MPPLTHPRPSLPTHRRPSMPGPSTMPTTIPTTARRSTMALEDYSPLSNLDDWVVLDCIGQGSFGVIHRVQRKSDGHIAAMKQLDYSKLSAKDRRQMVEEVRILGSLKNRHVVQLVDKIMDMSSSKCYIIMEYCGGGDLGKLLDQYRRKNRSIPEPIVWNYFIQLTIALHHCHHPEDRGFVGLNNHNEPGLPTSTSGSSSGSVVTGTVAGGGGGLANSPGTPHGFVLPEKKTSALIPGRELGLKKKLESLDIHSGDPLGLGIGRRDLGKAGNGKGTTSTTTGQVLHRDLKPENIFLDEYDNIKLGDFGLSKNLAAGSFTQTYVGTPLYMPPEILKESKYDHKSDIWSLGCLVYELCTLSSPFASAKSQTELLSKVMHGKWSPIGPSYSSGLRDLVTRMLSLDPARRPSTKDLQRSADMQHWRKEYDRKRTKMEQDKIAADLEKKVDQLLSFKETIATREKTCIERENTLEAREKEIFTKRDELEAMWHAEQAKMEETKAQMTAQYESSTKQIQEEHERVQTRDRELIDKEKDLVGRERELLWNRRELEMARADFEALVAKWNLERDNVESSGSRIAETSTPESDAVSALPHLQATRPALIERTTLPNVGLTFNKPRKSSPLGNPSLDFMELDSPARAHLIGASPSMRSGIPRASPRNDTHARNGTPLRSGGRLSTKSFNDLRARAKADAERPSRSPTPGETSIIMMDVGTPIRPSRSDPTDGGLSEPGFDLDRLETTNFNKLRNALVEASQRQTDDVDVVFKRLAGKQLEEADFAPRPKINRPGLNHANTTNTTRPSSGQVSKIPLPAIDFVYKENATPAKWNVNNDDDVPSPFLKQSNGRVALASVAAGSPTPRERFMPRTSGAHVEAYRAVPPRRDLLRQAIKNRSSGEMVRPEGLMSPGASTVDRLL